MEQYQKAVERFVADYRAFGLKIVGTPIVEERNGFYSAVVKIEIESVLEKILYEEMSLVLSVGQVGETDVIYVAGDLKWEHADGGRNGKALDVMNFNPKDGKVGYRKLKLS